MSRKSKLQNSYSTYYSHKVFFLIDFQGLHLGLWHGKQSPNHWTTREFPEVLKHVKQYDTETSWWSSG